MTCTGKHCISDFLLTQCENFHRYIKARLLEEIANYQPAGGIPLLCEELTRRLRNLIKEYESQRLTDQWIAKATDVVLSLRGKFTYCSGFDLHQITFESTVCLSFVFQC